MVTAQGMQIKHFLEINYFQHCRNDIRACEVLRACLREASPFWREALSQNPA
jgi:hypothetical protein